MLVTYLFLFTTRRKKKLATKINEGKNNNSLFTRFSDIKFFFANFKFFSSNFCHYTYVEDSPIENMFISWPNEKYTVFFFFLAQDIKHVYIVYCIKFRPPNIVSLPVSLELMEASSICWMIGS